jgi:hypothetical protein
MDATCWAIICAMGTAIGGMAAFVKILWSDLQECQKARVKALQDQLSLVRVATNEVDPHPKNDGGVP